MVPIHGGAHDAPGVAGPFSRRIQPPAVHRLAILSPEDPHRRRSPGLHPDHQPPGAESGQLPFKIHQPVLQGFRHEIRQDLPQVRRHQPRPVTGTEAHLQIRRRFLHKAPAALGRCPVIPAHLPGQMLILPLEFHAPQRSRREIPRVHTHHQGAVGQARIPFEGAHAVDHQASLFRSGSHHLAPGAHAEGIHRPSGFLVVEDQSVIRRSQFGMVGELPVLGLVNQSLFMLNPHSHRKSLGLQMDGPFQQGLIGVPGAVAAGQDHSVGIQPLPAIQFHRRQPPLRIHPEIRHLGLVPDLATSLFDPADQPGDHEPQFIRAHMRFLFRQNFFRSPGFHKGPEQMAHNGVVDPGGQLPVGKGPGATGSELHIAHRIQFPGFPEGFHVLHPVLQVPAPFHHQRCVPLPGQFQGRHKARRSQADYHRPSHEFFRSQHRRRFRLFLPQAHLGIPEQPVQHPGRCFHPGPHMVHQADAAFPPGIHRLPDHLDLPDGPGCQMVLLPDDLFQGMAAVQPHPEIIDSDFHWLCHPAVPFLSAR